MVNESFELTLGGCTPEPLMNYLKALGILRLVAEQKDPQARGAWRNDVFILRSLLDREALQKFFLEEYRPTPIVVPWSGGDFLAVNHSGSVGPFEKTPTSTKAIEAFLASSSERIILYRQTILKALEVLKACNINVKADMEKKELKAVYLACLRSRVDDAVVEWIDAATIMTTKKATFSAILGSGGGSDGNTHFSDNFMQNLWEVLPDFDEQRGSAGQTTENQQISLGQFNQAVFGETTNHLVYKRTSSLYDSGAVGGPNATQGLDRGAFGNPWSFILCLEGSICLAGAISRRERSIKTSASFPFQVRLATVGLGSTAPSETTGYEIWLPLFSAWTAFYEVRELLAEARSDISHRKSRSGVDFARAATGLGVDRGINVFQRFGIVKNRLGDTNTAASFGRLRVQLQGSVGLLGEVDLWLDRFRSASSRKEAPPRFSRALHRIDQSIFAFCQFGGAVRFAEILCALGCGEQELIVSEKFCTDNTLSPLGNLSTAWLSAANDGSVEFELALSLASIFDSERKIGALRENLEPVVFKNKRLQWADKTGAVVWNNADLAVNLASVLTRRVMDGDKHGCVNLPLSFKRAASLESVCAFLYGQINERRLEEFLWGLMLIDHSATKEYPKMRHVKPQTDPLPRAYALLKLLFLPSALNVEQQENGCRLVKAASAREGGVHIKPEQAVLALLRAGHQEDAVNKAGRRLRASGLVPKSGRRPYVDRKNSDWKNSFGIQPQRLAAALLFPVSSSSIGALIELVIREGSADSTATH